jgi:hypothetical protein
MRRITCRPTPRIKPRAALALGAALALALGAAPALAQPGAEPAGQRGSRSLTATGQTKPPGSVGGAPMKPINEAAMIKAQKAAEARNKAWDTKMRTTLGSICRGC